MFPLHVAIALAFGPQASAPAAIQALGTVHGYDFRRRGAFLLHPGEQAQRLSPAGLSRDGLRHRSHYQPHIAHPRHEGLCVAHGRHSFHRSDRCHRRQLRRSRPRCRPCDVLVLDLRPPAARHRRRMVY